MFARPVNKLSVLHNLNVVLFLLLCSLLGIVSILDNIATPGANNRTVAAISVPEWRGNTELQRAASLGVQNSPKLVKTLPVRADGTVIDAATRDEPTTSSPQALR